jgi:hypothetical protein
MSIRKKTKSSYFFSKNEVDIFNIVLQREIGTSQQIYEALNCKKPYIIILRGLHTLLDKKVLVRMKIEEEQFYRVNHSNVPKVIFLKNYSNNQTNHYANNASAGTN